MQARRRRAPAAARAVRARCWRSANASSSSNASARADAAVGGRGRRRDLRIVRGALRSRPPSARRRRLPQAAAASTCGSASAASAAPAPPNGTPAAAARARGGSSSTLSSALAPDAVEFVDRIDDGDAPAALACGRAEERHRPAHVVDGDLLAQHAFLVRRALQNEKIACACAATRRATGCVRVDGERRRRCTSAAAGSGWASTKRAMR